MADADWHRCKFLESGENLKPLVKKRFGREPSSSLAREIVACLQQGRLFYEAAASSPLEIRPMLQFYGMVGFSKALVVASRNCSLSTLRPAHGLKDISAGNSRIADLRLRIETAGTFQEFNDVVAALARISYFDNTTRRRAIYLPSASSTELTDIELSLKEILSRVPGLESLFRMTFGEDPQAEVISLETAYQNEVDFRISIYDPQLLADRESLKEIVGRWRSRFPFLKIWRLTSAQQAWGYSTVYFRNMHNSNIDEFSEEYLTFESGSFQERPVSGDQNELFPLEEGLHSVAGAFTGSFPYAISPVTNLYLSEFSIQYLGLFLLSSLVRYRPQTWTHAISRSVTAEEPADDRALSLIGRFLDINTNVIPEMVVKILNPYEDYSFD
jgi:hypothetical protein